MKHPGGWVAVRRPGDYHAAPVGPGAPFDQNSNVPVAMARQLAARIPGSSLTVYPGEGHLIVPKHWDEILAALLGGG